jgi:hypothetical protein
MGTLVEVYNSMLIALRFVLTIRLAKKACRTDTKSKHTSLADGCEWV